MLFNSITFLLFLTLVVITYWNVKFRPRTILLFTASLVFYGFWRWDFLALLMFSTVLDYFIALGIDRSDNKQRRKILLLLSLSANLGLLVVFKYLYFIELNINNAMEIFHISGGIQTLNLILPLGISFYTFQTISYSIDVYRGHLKPEKDFFLYGTFVTFFPQLVAGPILRASEVVPELKDRKLFDWNFILEGSKRILIGLFLKVVLADNIATHVDVGFQSNPMIFSALDVVALSFLFGFQIYFDFAGYSHIAIGSAKLMGISFPENFNFPYIASSFKDFWKRWHISLSSWIRDYLYLPILGVEVQDTKAKSKGGIESVRPSGKRGATFALFTTWAIMGLWHGANWTFVFWGIYHASLVYIERKWLKLNILNKFRNKVSGWLIVFPLAMLSWIPFRALNLTDTFTMYSKLFCISEYFKYSLRENNFLIVLILIIGTTIAGSISVYNTKRINSKPNLGIEVLKSVGYGLMLFLVFVFLRPISQFIYFQF
jgi:alginate O-acetyltransferase complex protein AlgI